MPGIRHCKDCPLPPPGRRTGILSKTVKNHTISTALCNVDFRMVTVPKAAGNSFELRGSQWKSGTFVRSAPMIPQYRVPIVDVKSKWSPAILKSLDLSIVTTLNPFLSEDKVDYGIGAAHGKCFGVDSGVDKRWGYSQLWHRVPYTMFFFWFGLGWFTVGKDKANYWN